MRLPSVTLSASILAFAVILGAVAITFRSSQRAQAELADARREYIHTVKDIQTWSDRLDTVRRAASLVSSEKKLPIAAQAAQGRHPRPDPVELVATHPELRGPYLKSYRHRSHIRYLPLYLTLGLSAGQISKFEDLLVNGEEDKIDLLTASLAQGVPTSDPNVAAMQKQSAAQLQTAETDLLGQAGFQALQSYDRASFGWGLATDVSTLAAAQENPLSLAQEQQLITVAANASGSYQAGGKIDPATFDREEVLAQASNFLSPTQLAALASDTAGAPLQALVKQFYQSAASGPPSH